MNNLNKILVKRIIFLDGATGTNLLNKGIKPGESPSILNVQNPGVVYRLQKAYVDAGSDIILTNTFSANPLNFPSDRLREVITEGIKLAKRAANNKATVLGDVGPLGSLIKPYGEMDFREAVEIYKKIFRIFHQSGIRIFLIETFTSIIEAKAAFLAARNFSKNILVSFSLAENGRTIMGEIPEAIAATFKALGAKGVGINCTLPGVAIEALAKMAKITNLPLLVKPNVGKIEIVDNEVHYDISDYELARYFRKFVQAGARMIGGCCGTTPDYIKMIAQNKQFKNNVVATYRLSKIARKFKEKFILTSPQRALIVKNDSSILVGERLNPSGRKKVKERLLAKDYKIYGEEAKLQQEAGAQALDVNAFVIDLDEKSSLVNAIYEVLKNSQLPLFIDTQNFEAAEQILSFYPGIGVYNSIPARKRELQKWLPMVKKYGFKAVISLVGKTIPHTDKERMANVGLSLKIAQNIGFPKEDLIFDPLVFSIATEPAQTRYTLKTVTALGKMGLKTILGISNVSFGLPNRSWLNATLAAAAIKSGAAFLILNPLDEIVMNAVSGAKALFKGENFPPPFPRNKFGAGSPPRVGRDKGRGDLVEALVYGDGKSGVELSKRLFDSGTPPQVIIDNYITKALKTVGDYYETGRFFIPDLLKSAEAAKAVLAIIKKYLPKGKRKGRVVLATVKGDIHDIGKNIAGMVFESAGYEVIDLGKDVSREKIAKAVKRYKPDVLGLSALLTTTMTEMENVIKRLKKERLNVKVIIGGPNVSEDYAKKIGAFGAARNVLEGLKILKKIK